MANTQQMKYITSILLTILLGTSAATAQTILSEQEAVDLALKNSPFLTAADLQVKQHRQLEGKSFNLANPDIVMESPTGEFMTIGVLQSFEFPSVYIKQGELAKQQTLLAEKGKKMTEADIRQRVKTAYLHLQFANQILQQLKKQDSIFFNISDAANRQFTAGQIDFVAKTYSAAQYSEVHNRYLQAQTDALIALQQLQLYTGIDDSISTTPFAKGNTALLLSDLVSDSSSTVNTPFAQYQIQAQSVAVKSLELEKTKALPGFTLGYMNQGLRNTIIPLRFSVGLNVPIWFWQYKATIKAAQTNVEITGQNILGQSQNLAASLNQVKGDVLKFQTSIDFYEKVALKQADDLISSSSRMFSAGQTDYITYLRTLSDAFDIQVKYLETIRSFNQSVISLNFLTGK